MWIDNIRATLPFNLNTLYQVFPEYLAQRLEKKLVESYGYNVRVSILRLKEQQDEDLKFLADYVYEKVFANYTFKQWGISAQDIDPEIMARVPLSVSRDDGYFQDKYQAIPSAGYTQMIRSMLAHPLITVRLNTACEKIKGSVEYKRLFYTGTVDGFFGYKFGQLPYRSLRFDIEHKNTEYYQPCAVTNYPNNFDFTRICEHKYFLNEKAPTTVISVEFPQPFKSGENESYYPISSPENLRLYKRYLEESKKMSEVYFLGRLEDYKYYNMEQTVTRALDLFESIKK